MKIGLILLLCLTTSCHTAHRITSNNFNENEKPLEKNIRDVAYATPMSDGQKLTFAKLRNMAMSEGNIEALLSKLKKTYSEYMSYHTLVYHSNSLHESTFEEPRAIVFGPDAKFILTFNGGPHQRGGSKLETMEWSPIKKQFLFREISFKKYNNNDDLLNKTFVEIENDVVQVSKANPQKCLDCHGSKATPIWESYFMWPGVYGSSDDDLTFRSLMNNELPVPSYKYSRGARVVSSDLFSQFRLFNVKNVKDDTETGGFLHFLSNKSDHPRYQHLPDRISDIAYISYLDQTPVQADTPSKFGSWIYNGWPIRPNLFLTTALNRLNQERLINELQKAGLKDFLVGKNWPVRFSSDKQDPTQYSEKALSKIAGTIWSFLRTLSLKKHPSKTEILSKMKENISSAHMYQFEKMTRLAQSFPRNALQRTSLPDEIPMSPEQKGYLLKLMGVESLPFYGEAALNIAVNNIPSMTALNYILLDRGIDLTEFSTDLRHGQMQFIDGYADFNHVFGFLGLDHFPQQER